MKSVRWSVSEKNLDITAATQQVLIYLLTSNRINRIQSTLLSHGIYWKMTSHPNIRQSFGITVVIITSWCSAAVFYPCFCLYSAGNSFYLSIILCDVTAYFPCFTMTKHTCTAITEIFTPTSSSLEKALLIYQKHILHFLCTISDSCCHKTTKKSRGALVLNLFWRQCSPTAKSPPAAPEKILHFPFHAPSWEPNPSAVSCSLPKMITCADRHHK